MLTLSHRKKFFYLLIFQYCLSTVHTTASSIRIRVAWNLTISISIRKTEYQKLFILLYYIRLSYTRNINYLYFIYICFYLFKFVHSFTLFTLFQFFSYIISAVSQRRFCWLYVCYTLTYTRLVLAKLYWFFLLKSKKIFSWMNNGIIKSFDTLSQYLNFDGHK